MASVLGLPDIRKMKWLYVLGMFQLIAGPLMILQVTLLCKLTFREMPEEGIGPAVSKAWHSGKFQAALVTGNLVTSKSKESPSPTKEPVADSGKQKMPVTDWRATRPLPPPSIGLAAFSDWCRRWTPVWPQAPPEPPPRIG
jgi:hypothetical protein